MLPLFPRSAINGLRTPLNRLWNEDHSIPEAETFESYGSVGQIFETANSDVEIRNEINRKQKNKTCRVWTVWGHGTSEPVYSCMCCYMNRCLQQQHFLLGIPRMDSWPRLIHTSAHADLLIRSSFGVCCLCCSVQLSSFHKGVLSD